MNVYHPFPFEKLIAYQVAREVLAGVIALVENWPRGWSDLRDHAKRAATSSVLNLAEGACQPKGSLAKGKYFSIALGSSGELAAALDVAMVHRLSSARDLKHVQDNNRRLAALLTGLIHSARR